LAGHVAHIGQQTRNVHKILVRKPECVDWIHLVHDSDQWWALVNMVLNLRVP